MRLVTLSVTTSVMLAASMAARAASPNFATLYSFSTAANGQGPNGIAFINNQIYGDTVAGGSDSNGVIFQLDPTSGTETVLTNFTTENLNGFDPIGLNALGKSLYVSTLESGGNFGAGTIYKYDTANGKNGVFLAFDLLDPACFSNGLINVGGQFYGTCPQGSPDYGILFRVNPKNHSSTILFSFQDGPEGGYPAGPMVLSNGVIYGVVQSVSGDTTGGIFAYNLASGTESVVHPFNQNKEGGDPDGLAMCKGVLYGFNNTGGKNNLGTAFSYDPSTGTEKTVYSFQDGTDSAAPFAPAPVCAGKDLVATAGYGGANGYGTVFEIKPTAGTETLLHSFAGADGAYPIGGVILHAGAYYGTTVLGPTASGIGLSGTVFELTP